jgi:hypothetical protein
MTIIGTGPRNARQDSGGRRKYTWQGRELPSVTSVPKLAGIPDRLHRWFIGNLIDYVLTNHSDIGLRVATGDEREIGSLRRDLWQAVQGQQRSRIVGIAVHRAASEGHDPNTVHPSIGPKLRQYLDWRDRSGAVVLGSEFQCWNLTEGYAGTADLMVRFADGSVWLIDLKTGKGVYSEAALQLTAYLMAEFIGSDDVVDERMTALLHAVSGIGVLHLNDEGWEFTSLRLEPDTWTAYRGLLRFGSWVSNYANLEDLTAVRRRSDGQAARTDAWVWSRIGGNLAHRVPLEGDQALCFRSVERSRRVDLDGDPTDSVCQKCAARLAA